MITTIKICNIPFKQGLGRDGCLVDGFLEIYRFCRVKAGERRNAEERKHKQEKMRGSENPGCRKKHLTRCTGFVQVLLFCTGFYGHTPKNTNSIQTNKHTHIYTHTDRGQSKKTLQQMDAF